MNLLAIALGAVIGYVGGGQAYDRFRLPAHYGTCVPVPACFSDEQIARISHERLAAQAVAGAVAYLVIARVI